MNRTDLLNYLIGQRGLRRYLEIGVSDEQANFAHVACPHKIGVDPKPVTTFQGTSDAFFAQNQAVFDLVFIDGLHTEEQVLRDLDNANRCLARGGLVVLHDCLPPDAWHQRGPEAYQEGESWNGPVWKAVLRYFNQSPHHCAVLDTDWGCGVIDTARPQVPAALALPERLDYEAHYPLLFRYKVSVAAYLRGQVAVFYHLACMGNWAAVFTEQMHQLAQHGFRQIELTALGSAADLQAALTVCEGLGMGVRVVFWAAELTQYETPALLAIEAHARQHPGFVLYLHSKGVSSPADDTKTRWRQLMMRELVENWEACVLQLPHYDAVGVNWRDVGSISHFSGNFWYASTRYLRTLPDFAAYYAEPRYSVGQSGNGYRLGCEFWIGAAAAPPRVLSLVCRNEDFCAAAYWHNH